MEMTIEQQRAIAMANARLRAQAAEAPAPKEDDVYTSAAKADIADLNAKGISTGSPMQRRILHGATLGAGDEILAGLATPIEMFKRGTFNPAEGYRYAKAYQDQLDEKAREETGALGTAAEIGGGFITGSGLANAGVTAARFLPQGAGVASRSAAAGADALGFGAVSGAMEGNSLEERAKNAAFGGGTGALIGGATPGVLKVAGTVASPIISNIRARVNPEGYGQTQVARAIMESSNTPQQIAAEVGQAAREGQGVYTVADAMGIPGQRMLSSVTRAPGPGRTMATEFLEQRQAGQGRRVANALAEGFDAPQTAAQTEARLTAARDRASDIAYENARQGAGPVDLSRAVANIDATLQPGVTQIARPQSGIANDSIEAALQGFRNRLTDGRSMLTDYTAVERVRGDLADAVSKAVRAGEGNRARLLGGALREIDAAMENASTGFRAANAQHARTSRAIDAVGEGTDAAMRGRTEDTIPRFRSMPDAAQQAYRAGYVDPLIAQVQTAPVGANKARSLTSDAFRDEAAAIAPMRTQAQMQRRLARENTMFDTRQQALGGSKTADNLADESSLQASPSIIARIGSAGLTGGLRNIISVGHNVLNGNTPEVRQEVARLLTMRGGNVSPQQLQGILDEAIRRVEAVRHVAAVLGRGASAAMAVAPAATGQR